MNVTVRQPKPRRLLRRVLLGISLTSTLYVASYAFLSVTGGWVVSESGQLRPFGLAEVDIFQWQPRFGFCQRFLWSSGHYGLRADALGYFYAPLILLDQGFVHRTIRFVSQDGTMIEPIPSPPVSEYHPRMVNPFAGRFPYEPVRKNSKSQ